LCCFDFFLFGFLRSTSLQMGSKLRCIACSFFEANVLRCNRPTIAVGSIPAFSDLVFYRTGSLQIAGVAGVNRDTLWRGLSNFVLVEGHPFCPFLDSDNLSCCGILLRVSRPLCSIRNWLTSGGISKSRTTAIIASRSGSTQGAAVVLRFSSWQELSVPPRTIMTSVTFWPVATCTPFTEPEH